MPKISSPPFQVDSRTRCLGGLIFCSSSGNFIFFFQFSFWFILEQCIFDLCTIVLMKGFKLRLFFADYFSIVALCSKHDFLDPCPMEGPIKSLFSVSLSICSSAFLSGIGCYFFQIFSTMVDEKLTESSFPGKIIFPQIWAKISQNGPKLDFVGFFEKFCHQFSWKKSKVKTNIVNDISPPITYLAKLQFSSYGPKSCWLIEVQDSLKCNISRKK